MELLNRMAESLVHERWRWSAAVVAFVRWSSKKVRVGLGRAEVKEQRFLC